MATTTSTVTATEPTQASAPADKPAIKPHFMTATWHLQDPSTWNFWQRMIIYFDIHPHPKGTPPAPIKTNEKVPHYAVWRQHVYIFPRAVLPLVLHWGYMKATGWTLHPVAAFLFYMISLKMFSINCIRKFNRMGQVYGYFNGMRPRDGIPDSRTKEVVISLLLTISVRPLFAIFFAYDRTELPSLSLWFPLQLFAYCTILDFFFWSYHAAMHQSETLWKFHATHHKAKAPNSLLAPFADEVQEWGDILVIPLLTYLVMPVNFATWWMCTVYIIYAEIMGHTGVRLYWQVPSTGWILRPFNMDLCLADHDLHHSQGWKKSGNYGKQTKLWDTLFGTTMPRTECREENIDWNAGPVC